MVSSLSRGVVQGRPPCPCAPRSSVPSQPMPGPLPARETFGRRRPRDDGGARPEGGSSRHRPVSAAESATRVLGAPRLRMFKSAAESPVG